ncbi:thioether cross-link-forming SCIFF peptide maturase [Xylanivirga thermophila]|jgi:uncharacterized protein|uniref:thioether cross-link-forming SCIFF peptide maturase n=1 Tax=Xylanivirga thermophila TaxID=2496273 RepID=UPI00101B713E|nr:thioether cross-link-forming SCIFF peptide maturase [Xylanivirga thermophila]
MIHKFEVNDIKMVLDVNSGAVHVIDDMIWDLLDYGPEFELDKVFSSLSHKYDKKDLTEGIDELRQLIKEDMLYSEWGDTIPYVAGPPVVKAMCLHAAHDCNLRCGYCFASTGSFNGERGMLDFETGRNALDFLISHSGNRKNLEVDFFGGEPLMNFDVVKQVVSYGRELEKRTGKTFKFTVTTNGVLLNDEIIDYINKEFVNVVISIDGRPQIHDAMRKTLNGKGSYEAIIDKAQKLAELRNQNDYYVRGTFTKHNLDFDQDVLHLADCGFKQISIEPVVAPEEEDYSIREEDLPRIFKSYDNLTKEYINRRRKGQGFNFFHFQVDLNQGPCAAKRALGCGAGNEYVAVASQGDIYPCHQFVGEKNFKMGNVNEGTFDTDMQLKFRGNNVFTKEDCSKCWAKFYCSGGCVANSYHFTGGIKKPYKLGCEMEKKRLECALAIKALEMLDSID